MSEPESAVSAATPSLAGLRWWQALLLYPTLATGLFAGVPRVWEEYKAFRMGIARNQLQIAQEQEKIWARNLDCLTHAGIYEVDGPDGLIVKVSLCPGTGDTLLRYHLGEWTPRYRWVAKPDIKDMRK